MDVQMQHNHNNVSPLQVPAHNGGVRKVEGLTRDEVCSRYQAKVAFLGRRVAERLPPNASIQLNDLLSWGAIGLLEAFDRYDASRGIKFSTYAEYRIRGAMYDALRAQDSFSRRRRMLARRVGEAQDEVRRRVGHEPSPMMIAEELTMSLDEYWSAVDRVQPVSHVSFTAVDDSGRPLSETLASDDGGPGSRLTASEACRNLRVAISQLPERERHCIQMYYGKDLTLAEIAAVYNVTVSRISQILTVARGRLRKKLAPTINAEDLNDLALSA
jgi:RNA polymerase sigma factor for flagellar operon FliA